MLLHCLTNFPLVLHLLHTILTHQQISAFPPNPILTAQAEIVLIIDVDTKFDMLARLGSQMQYCLIDFVMCYIANQCAVTTTCVEAFSHWTANFPSVAFSHLQELAICSPAPAFWPRVHITIYLHSCIVRNL